MSADERRPPAVDPEPTDMIDPVLPDRPRIWPETPRPLKTQVKRPMEEWLEEFSQRISQSSGGSEPTIKRRRARGLARLIPTPARTEPEPARRGRPAAAFEPGQEQRRGRRRRGGRGRSGGGGPVLGSTRAADPAAQGTGTERPPQDRRRSGRRQRPRGKGTSPLPGPPRQGEGEQRPPRAEGPSSASGAGGQAQRHRRRGRGRRGRGRGGGSSGPGPQPGGGAPPPAS